LDGPRNTYRAPSAGSFRDASVLEREDLLRPHASLATLFANIAPMFGLVRGLLAGHVRRVPANVVFSAVAALVYIISPIDLVPDPIPVAGLADDAFVFLWFVSRARAWLADCRRHRSFGCQKTAARPAYTSDNSLQKEAARGETQ